MTTDPCRDWRGALGAAALGNIDPAEEIALRAHLDGCAECRAELRELTAVAQALPLVGPGRERHRRPRPSRPTRSPAACSTGSRTNADALRGAAHAGACSPSVACVRGGRGRGDRARARRRRRLELARARGSRFPASTGRARRPRCARRAGRHRDRREGRRAPARASTTGCGSPATTSTASAPGRSAARSDAGRRRASPPRSRSTRRGGSG